MSDTQTFLDTLAARSQQRAGEPTWIAARRQAGAARFEAMGFPTRRDEEWKYTDVRAIAKVGDNLKRVQRMVLYWLLKNEPEKKAKPRKVAVAHHLAEARFDVDARRRQSPCSLLGR